MLIRILLTLAFFAALLAAFLFFAPGFLVHADKSFSADAVVLFSGPGQKHRLEEARRLMREGYAKVLIIPDFGIVSRAEENGALEPVASGLWRQDTQQKVPLMSSYPRYFESTHVEALEAKRILDRLGLRSALMVSSPYHTQRISMICNRVFRGGYDFAVVPARMQQAYSFRDWLDKEARKKIVSEYVKMIWFLLYEPFSG